ncbi:MAG: transporter [Vicinamibacteria bacterium]|nr:transporter [Vicinamibacteria bacterium]
MMALLIAMTPIAALAQTRPLLTEEAKAAPAGTLVVETGLDYMGNEPNFVTDRPRDRVNGPMIRLVYSPADTVEFDLEWTSFVSAIRDDDFGDATDYGDVALRAKLGLLRSASESFVLATRFGVTLPQTSAERGLGPNTLRASADLLLSWRASAWSFHANAGLAIQDQVGGATAQTDFLAYGLAVEKSLSTRLTLVGELAGLLGNGKPGTDARSETRLGLRCALGAARLDVAARRGLEHADGEWGATIGASWSGRLN